MGAKENNDRRANVWVFVMGGADDENETQPSLRNAASNCEWLAGLVTASEQASPSPEESTGRKAYNREECDNSDDFRTAVTRSIKRLAEQAAEMIAFAHHEKQLLQATHTALPEI
jgi:hypothetical protein